MDNEQLPPDLQEKLDEVEKQNKSVKRFNMQRGFITAVPCLFLFFLFAYLFCKTPLGDSIIFAIIGGITGLAVGGFRKENSNK